MSRAAAISAPRVETPTTNTSTRSSRCSAGRAAASPSAYRAAGMVPPRAAARAGRCPSSSAPTFARARRRLAPLALYPRPLRMRHVRILHTPWLFRLPGSAASTATSAARSSSCAPAGGGLQRPRSSTSSATSGRTSTGGRDVALLPVAGLREQRARGRGAARRGGHPGRRVRSLSRRERGEGRAPERTRRCARQSRTRQGDTARRVIALRLDRRAAAERVDRSPIQAARARDPGADRMPSARPPG